MAGVGPLAALTITMSVPNVAALVNEAVNVRVVPSLETAILLTAIAWSGAPDAGRKSTRVAPPRFWPNTVTVDEVPWARLAGEIEVITGPVLAETGGESTENSGPISTATGNVIAGIAEPFCTITCGAAMKSFVNTLRTTLMACDAALLFPDIPRETIRAAERTSDVVFGFKTRTND